MGVITGMLNAGITLFSPSSAASTVNRPLVSGSGNATSFGNRLLYPTAQSDNYTAAVGDLVIMTTAGTSKTVTLPASPATGDRIGVRYKAQTAGDTVTIAPNGKDIEGVAAASVDLKLFVANDTYGLHDYIELVYDGTEWWIDVDRRVPHSSRANLTTAEASSETAATWTKVPTSAGVWTLAHDIGGLWDNTNKRFLIRRDGRYSFLAMGRSQGLFSAADKYFGVRVLVNGTNEYCTGLVRSPTTSVVLMAGGHDFAILSAGDYVEYQFINEEGSHGVAVTDSGNAQDGVTRFWISEMNGNGS